MNQLWTVIFIILFSVAFGLASWHDSDKRKRLERKLSSHEMPVSRDE